MERTITLPLQHWERIDMALDIAIFRSKEYGDSRAVEQYRESQQLLIAQIVKPPTPKPEGES